jgi:hypothetical protein
MVTQPPRHVEYLLPGGELVYLVRPEQRWQLSSYECGHPETGIDRLLRGYTYWHSFLEPWRHLEFESPEAGARFIQQMIERGGAPPQLSEEKMLPYDGKEFDAGDRVRTRDGHVATFVGYEQGSYGEPEDVTVFIQYDRDGRTFSCSESWITPA